MSDGDASNDQKVSLDAATRTIYLQQDSRWYSDSTGPFFFYVTACVNDSAGTCEGSYVFSYISSINCIRFADAEEASVKDSGGTTITEVTIPFETTATVYVQRATNDVAPESDPD